MNSIQFHRPYSDHAPNQHLPSEGLADGSTKLKQSISDLYRVLIKRVLNLKRVGVALTSLSSNLKGSWTGRTPVGRHMWLKSRPAFCLLCLEI